MTLSEILFLLIALAVCVTVHEAAHAWVASKLGDQTAKMQGRVSLNPARHLDPVGTLMILFIHFGWGRPVTFDPRNLKNPIRDAALISLAGPMTNLLTALALAPILRLDLAPYPYVLLRTIYDLSIILFIFNLLPIPPLDGSKLIGLIVPKSKQEWYENYMRQGYIYIILLIIFDRASSMLLGFSPLGMLIAYLYEPFGSLIGLSTS